MSALDFTTAEWADGAALMRWVDRQVEVVPATEAQRRKLDRWRQGAQASFWDVDALLVAHGLHVAQVPRRVWKTYTFDRRRREAVAA